MGPATSVTAVGPAYMALVAEAQVDAAVRHGLKPDLAGSLAAETMAGTAALLQERGYDTLTVRREVTSPGGSTARGLDALERGGLRSAFSEAMDRVLGSDRMILVVATARTDVANYVSALFEVYIALIFIYILLNLLFSFGLRAALLALERCRAQLPARRLGAVPARVSPVHPPARRLRPVPDDRDHRPVRRAVADPLGDRGLTQAPAWR